MLEQPIGKMQALVLCKQLTKQIDTLVNKKVENWDIFGNIKDTDLHKKIEAEISAKKIRRAEYRALSL